MDAVKSAVHEALVAEVRAARDAGWAQLAAADPLWWLVAALALLLCVAACVRSLATRLGHARGRIRLLSVRTDAARHRDRSWSA